jgi:uncharacterized iron-regulated membrane protein
MPLSHEGRFQAVPIKGICLMSLTFARSWPGYSAIWRWHFYAGLFCIPFVLWLACTGSIYLWKRQVETLLDRPYAHVADGLKHASPSAIATAAVNAVPGSMLHQYQLPETSGQAVQMLVGKGERETRVYVNPATLSVLKSVDEDSRLMPTIFRLHGELLLGNKGSYIVELAASWAIVMIITGLALWWPRGGGLAGVVYPRLALKERRFWRDLHAVVGFWVSLFALCFLISGLPWAASWGAYLETARSLAGPRIVAPDWRWGSAATFEDRAQNDAGARAALVEHAEHHHGMSSAMASSNLTPLDALVPVVAKLDLPFPALVAPPKASGQPWTARSDTQDRPRRVDLTLDPATARVLNQSRFHDKPALDQAVDYGVAAHEGHLFGLANQLLNLTMALGLITLSISGFIMWRKRKPGKVLGAPPAEPSKPVAIGFVALTVGLCLLLPMLAVSMLAVLVIETLILRRIPGARRWLGLRSAAA